MATFKDEPVDQLTWERIEELTAFGKTVEVIRDDRQNIILRVWSGLRNDGSNQITTDSHLDY